MEAWHSEAPPRRQTWTVTGYVFLLVQERPIFLTLAKAWSQSKPPPIHPLRPLHAPYLLLPTGAFVLGVRRAGRPGNPPSVFGFPASGRHDSRSQEASSKKHLYCQDLFIQHMHYGLICPVLLHTSYYGNNPSFHLHSTVYVHCHVSTAKEPRALSNPAVSIPSLGMREQKS